MVEEQLLVGGCFNGGYFTASLDFTLILTYHAWVYIHPFINQCLKYYRGNSVRHPISLSNLHKQLFTFI